MDDSRDSTLDRDSAAEQLLHLQRSVTTSPTDEIEDSFTITSATTRGESIIVTSNAIVKRPEIPEAPAVENAALYQRFETQYLPPKKNKTHETCYKNHKQDGEQLNQVIELLIEFEDHCRALQSRATLMRLKNS